MGQVRVIVNTDNAAFEDGGITYEMGRIFSKLAHVDILDKAYNNPNILDSNGNTVGTVEVID